MSSPSSLKADRDEHYYPVILLLAGTGLRIGEACGLRWRDVTLRTSLPRLTVVWQLDKWAGSPRGGTSPAGGDAVSIRLARGIIAVAEAREAFATCPRPRQPLLSTGADGGTQRPATLARSGP